MDGITVTVDDREILTPVGSNRSSNGTFFLSNRKRSSPNWKLAISIALFTVAVGLAVVIVLTVFSKSEIPSSDGTIVFPVSSSPLGVYRYASVAADSGPCSQIGTSMLAKGGSAVDAAIAATLCTGIYNMHNAGIGGGMFMMIWDQKSQTAHALDARESAPLYASENMFEGPNAPSSLDGPMAIAIPGEIAGYWSAHQRFGRLPWKALFQPTISLCKNGIQVSSILAGAIKGVLKTIESKPDKAPFNTTWKYLINPKTNDSYKAGETITCPTLVRTLTEIAEMGGPAFYNGSIADDIIADLKEVGSPMTKADLASYSVVWRKPVEMALHNGTKMLGMPPPGSGGVMGLILNILAGYNWTNASSQDLVTYHRMVEAFKFGYGQRTIMGDGSYVPEMEQLIANLTSPGFGNYLKSLVDDSATHPTSFYLPTSHDSGIRNHGTSHISVVDGSGNAVSITSTINVYFGSLIMGKRTGIIFNDEMDDFSSPNKTNYFALPPSPQNFIKPGKRPMSSMTPTIFLDPDTSDGDSSAKYRVNLVIGAAGGSRITSGTAYVASRVLFFKENVKQAVDALRVHHQLVPETLWYEPGFPSMVLSDLRQRGHINQTEYLPTKGIMTVVQAIQKVENGTIFANADYRKNSFPDGF